MEGSAWTSLRRAALTCGVAAEGPATRKSVRASAAVSPLRSVRAPPMQPPAAAPAGLGVDGDTGHGQAFEVAAGRARADLELLGQLLGRDPSPGLEDQEGGHESVGAHLSSLSRKVARRWPL